MSLADNDPPWSAPAHLIKALVFIFAALQLLAGCAVRPVDDDSATTDLRSGRMELVAPGGRARTDALSDETRLLQNAAYEVIYSETKRNPLVVSYYLPAQSKQDSGGCKRPRSFVRDDRTRSRVTNRAFRNSGYDRGHLAPNAAIARRFGCAAQRETFLLTNIVPQLPGLNQRTWASLETIADTVYANEFNGVWILTGPVFDPTRLVTLCDADIEVPIAFWKIVVRAVDEHRIEALALIMSQQERGAQPIEAFTTTIDDIEARTGLDFFAGLPEHVEATLESSCPKDRWQLQRPLVPPNEGWGVARPVCVAKAVPRKKPLGTRHAPLLVCAPRSVAR